MTDSHPQTPHQHASTKHVVVVPNSVNMVSVLGPGDEHLGLIEGAFDADVHVRGNRITLHGEPGEVALAERLLDEMVTIIRTGQGVTTETVERIVAMLRADEIDILRFVAVFFRRFDDPCDQRLLLFRMAIDDLARFDFYRWVGVCDFAGQAVNEPRVVARRKIGFCGRKRRYQKRKKGESAGESQEHSASGFQRQGAVSTGI